MDHKNAALMSLDERRQEKTTTVTLPAKEAASYIGISYWLLLELAKQKKIPHLRLGRRVLFRKTALDNWMSNAEEANCQVVK